jgi:hypothetical protein
LQEKKEICDACGADAVIEKYEQCCSKGCPVYTGQPRC